MDKPYSPACERNQDFILAVLRRHLEGTRRVLELGSGTGQHAVHFARGLPHLTWQASDVRANLGGIRQWLSEADLANTPPPLEFDIDGTPPAGNFDAIFTSNTLHIMSWPQVQRTFDTLPSLINAGGYFIAYGPFNYEGRYTSPSNEAFDEALKLDAPTRGIRDFEAIDALATKAGLHLVEDAAMPANNRCITWRAQHQPASEQRRGSRSEPLA